MVKSKKEYVCSNCTKTFLRWQAECDQCSTVGTIQEHVLVPAPIKSHGTSEAQRLRRRAKGAERNIARRMINVDGVDPAFAKIASSTGRIGHITNMRVDAVSLNYVIEEKNRKIPVWLAKAWLVINQRAIDWNKNALLHVTPPNIAKDFPVNGQKYKLDTLAIITQTRHEELIRKEKALDKIAETLNIDDDAEMLQIISETLQNPNLKI